MCQVTMLNFACLSSLTIFVMRTNMSYQNACEIGQDKSWIHDFCRENIKQNLHLNVSKVSHPKNIHKLCNNSLFSADLCNKPNYN